jgi:hypothetical protein
MTMRTELDHEHKFDIWRDTDGGYWLQFRRCELDGCEKMEVREQHLRWEHGWVGDGPPKDFHSRKTVMHYTGGAQKSADLFPAFMIRLLWSTFLFCHGAGVYVPYVNPARSSAA